MIMNKIEEMARIMCSNSKAWTCRACNWGAIPDCDAYKKAMKLAEHGCIKLSEDDIVITKKEYDELYEDIDNLIYKLKEARKETATEILQKIKEIKTQDCGYTDWLDDTYFGDEYQKLLNKYGVEETK